jgi:hypothetical protein
MWPHSQNLSLTDRASTWEAETPTPSVALVSLAQTQGDDDDFNVLSPREQPATGHAQTPLSAANGGLSPPVSKR